MIIEFAGLRLYTLGLYTALGVLCAAAVTGVLGKSLGMKRGSAVLLLLFPILCGMVLSRLVFCLVYRAEATALPARLWFRVTDGGWSLAGLYTGVAAGGWIAARLTGEKTHEVSDVLCCAILPVLCAIRMGEARISGGGDTTVFYAAAAAALGLLMLLLAVLVRRRCADGTMTAVFLVLAGGGTYVIGRLRGTDARTAVLSQAAGAVMLAVGIFTAVRLHRKHRAGDG